MGVDRKMEVKAVKLGALDGVGYRSNAATDRKIESLRQRHFSLFAQSSPASPPPAEDSTTTKRCIDTSPNTPKPIPRTSSGMQSTALVLLVARD